MNALDPSQWLEQMLGSLDRIETWIPKATAGGKVMLLTLGLTNIARGLRLHGRARRAAAVTIQLLIPIIAYCALTQSPPSQMLQTATTALVFSGAASLVHLVCFERFHRPRTTAGIAEPETEFRPKDGP